MYNIIKLHQKDNVSVAPMNIPANVNIDLNLTSADFIPFGHKISLSKIEKNNYIYKYGQIIGIASKDILPGEHVHSHNLEFSEFERKFKINKYLQNVSRKLDPIFFDGYLRKNGKSGTRNYIGLLSTVNCSSTVVKKIADKINSNPDLKKFNNIDGAVCIKHSSGCGMNTLGYGMKVFNNTISGF